MSKDRVLTLPQPFDIHPVLLGVKVYYFTTNNLGFLPTDNTTFTLIEPPADLPTYAIANLQDFYLTPSPQFIVPLFMNLPSIFFSEFDEYHQVGAHDQHRLDLIAYQYYLNVEFWWIIAIANNILDPFNIAIGTILRIPSDNTAITQWLQAPVKKVRASDSFFLGNA